AAAIAAAVAIVASPLFPIGVARVAEPRPGLSVQGTTVSLGLLAGFVGVVVVVALSSWRALASRRLAPDGVSAGGRPSKVADVLARAGLPPTLTTGVRMSLDPGQGRRAVPVRTTIIGSVVAMSALAAALTFQASLSHLLTTPQLYGTAFDAQIEEANGDAFTVSKALPVLVADPEVAAVAVGYAAVPVRLGKVTAGAVALDVKKGTFPSILVEGRAPSGPDEVAVGTRTLRDLGARLGQSVDAQSLVSDAPPSPVRIVGRAVLPVESDTSGLGHGTVITVDGLRQVAGSANFADPTQAVVRFQPGVDNARARIHLQARLDDVDPGGTVFAPTRPNEVVDFGHVQNLPVVLAAILAVLATATIGHLLVSSVRRRRHDLAVLKSLGFLRRQAVAAVCWQATTLMVIALGVGVPLGVAIGRWTWGLLADQLGILPRPATPLLALLVLAPAALLLANTIAAAPAWSAGRTSSAVVLRSE
ncbi:MAG: hypothetical protein M3137_09085, partial [Actinomycetota bacterium]|nr:hypothetical protein [Actinomycetota bacterium]